MNWTITIDVTSLEATGNLTVRRSAEEGVVIIPSWIKATAQSEDGVVVKAETGLRPDDGTPQLVALTIDAKPGLPNDVLRTIGLGRLLAEMVRMGAMSIKQEWDEELGENVIMIRNPELSVEEAEALLRRRRSHVPQAELAEAVAAYKRAVASGTPDPTLATAREINRSRATAGRRLLMARRLGMMDEP